MSVSDAGCSDNPKMRMSGLACFSTFCLESGFAEKLPPSGRRPFCMQMILLQCLSSRLELRKIHLIIFMQVCRISPTICFNSW